MQSSIVIDILLRLNIKDVLNARLISKKWEFIFQSQLFQKHFQTDYSYLDEAGIIREDHLEAMSDEELKAAYEEKAYSLIATPRFKKEPPVEYPFICSNLTKVEMKPAAADGNHLIYNLYGRIAIAKVTADNLIKSAVIELNGNPMVEYDAVQELLFGESYIGYPTFSHEKPLIIGAYIHCQINLYGAPPDTLLTIEYYEDFEIKNIADENGSNKVAEENGADTGYIFKQLVTAKKVERIGGVARAIYVYTDDFRPISRAETIKINDRQMDLKKHIDYDMLRQNKYVYVFKEFPSTIYKIDFYKNVVITEDDVNILTIRDNLMLVGRNEMILYRYRF